MDIVTLKKIPWLSNELFSIHLAQEAAKLREVKVESPKKSNILGLTYDLLSKFTHMDVA